MKKMLLLTFAMLIMASVAGNAKADTYISFTSGGRPGGHHRHHHWDRGWHHRPHYSSYIYGPFWAPPRPRTVVYETTVVQPATRYIVDPALQAQAVSPTFTDSYGRTCREYQSTGRVAGSGHVVYGTACLQPDGAWRVVN